MTAAAIKQFNEEKYYTCIADPVMLSLFRHPKLSRASISVWLFIYMQTKLCPDNQTKIPLKRIGEYTRMSVRSVQMYVKQLKDNGFLLVTHTKEDDGILLFQPILPEAVIEEIKQAPNRRQAANHSTQFFASPHARSCVTPTQDPAYHINKDNNKNKHMYVSLECEEDDTQQSSITQPTVQHDFSEAELTEAERLNAKHHELFEVKYAHIASPLKRAQAIKAEFTEAEDMLLFRYLEYKDRLKEAQVSAASQQQPKSQSKAEAPQSQVVVEKAVPIDLQGQTYYVEPEVKKMACSQIPKLIAGNQLKGEAAKKSVTELLGEVLFYITKAGSKSGEVPNQRKRFFTARKLCMNGDWQRPRALVNQEIIQREQSAFARKAAEINGVVRSNGPALLRLGYATA